MGEISAELGTLIAVQLASFVTGLAAALVPAYFASRARRRAAMSQLVAEVTSNVSSLTVMVQQAHRRDMMRDDPDWMPPPYVKSGLKDEAFRTALASPDVRIFRKSKTLGAALDAYSTISPLQHLEESIRSETHSGWTAPARSAHLRLADSIGSIQAALDRHERFLLYLSNQGYKVEVPAGPEDYPA